MGVTSAYLPTATQAAMTASDASSIILSRYSTDFGQTTLTNLTNSGNLTAGFEGRLGGWNWSTAYTHGEARERSSSPQAVNSRFLASVDAVRDGGGNIVCRVSLTNPGLYPGCVPINLFGQGSPSAQAVEYFNGVSQYQSINKMDEFTANIAGEPFSVPAGPVSVDFGVNYRKQSMVSASNSDPAVPVNFTGVRGATPGMPRYFLLNNGVASGSYDSKEIYGETVVPLFRDLPGIRSLDFNGAVRFTDYSTSGGVYTWKVGGTWKPIDDLTVRATRSRDMRAPTLYDLFLGTQFTGQILTDIHTNTTSAVNQYTLGNPSLKPEEGNTWTAGVVYSPSSIRGLSASIDYYDLRITDAIATVSLVQANASCERSGGTDAVCAFITRPLPFSDRTPANFPNEVRLTPINLAEIHVAGFDAEASYNADLADFSDKLGGSVNVRLLASYIDRFTTYNGLGGAPFETAGVEGTPKWRGVLSAGYINGPLNLYAQARYVSDVKRDTPENTGLVYAENNVPSVTYVDVNASYKLMIRGHEVTPFINIKNLLSKDPPILASTFQVGHLFPTNASVYDVIGRTYTAGFRFAF